MNIKLLLIPAAALVLGACTTPPATDTGITPTPGVGTPPATQPEGTAPTDEAAEMTGTSFIQDVVASSPPTSDQNARERAFNLLSNNAQQVVGGSAQNANFAQFVGIQDVPDQGISVEDLQVNDNRATLSVGMNYSGVGQVIRNVNMVVEDNTWKVDSVTAPQPQP
jgi:hypothetical protein